MSRKFDVIIIGSGIGGLVTAAILSKKGMNVLVCEKNSYIGGYASSIDIEGFRFDVGAQDHTFLGKRGLEIINELDMQDDFIKITPHCKAIFPDYEFNWSTEDKTKEYFIKEFPEEEKGINDLFDEMEQIYNEIDHFTRYENLAFTLENHPHLLKNSSLCTTEFLNNYIRDDHLKSLLTTFSTFYQGSPPMRLSALHFAGLIESYFKVGAFYYRGGCTALTDKLRKIIEHNGGRIETDKEIKKIRIEGDAAVGVTASDDETIAGNFIVSNSDATNTFANLVGYEKLSPVFVSRLKRMRVGLSRCQLFIGAELNIPGDLPFVVFYKELYDFEKEVQSSINNEPVSMRCFIPTIVDSGLAKQGCQCISIAVLASYDNWIEKYRNGMQKYYDHSESLSDKLTAMVQRIFPKLAGDKIVVRKLITPVDLMKSTANYGGALYGWELTKSQTGTKRISYETPIRRLSLVGQWTVPGGSACLAFRSADIVSSAIKTTMEM